MSFLMVFKLFKFGAKQVKKRRHAGQYQQQQQQQQQPYYPNPYYQNQPPPNQYPPKNHQGWYENGNREMQFPFYTNGNGGDGDKPRRPPPTPKFFLNAILRFFQFVMGLTVVGLYGVDLHHAAQKGAYADSKWVYAQWTSGISVMYATMHILWLWCLERKRGKRSVGSYVKLRLPLFVWEVIVCVFWLTLFGIFGKMYLAEDPEGQEGIVRMKHAVWVDLVNLLLWCGSATWMGLRWWRGMKERKGEMVETATQWSKEVEQQEPAPVHRNDEREVPSRSHSSDGSERYEDCAEQHA